MTLPTDPGLSDTDYWRGFDAAAAAALRSALRADKRNRRWMLVTILAAFTAGLLLGVTVARAATLRPESQVPLGTLDPVATGPVSSEVRSTLDGMAPGGAPPEARTGAPQERAKTPAESPPAKIAALHGYATWFATGRNGPYAAAGPALRVGHWRGRSVSVSGPSGSALVVLNDFCACGERHGEPTLLDLSDEAFQAICGPLSRGVCHVSVTW